MRIIEGRHLYKLPHRAGFYGIFMPVEMIRISEGRSESVSMGTCVVGVSGICVVGVGSRGYCVHLSLSMLLPRNNPSKL